MNPKAIVFLDIETTGLDFERDVLLEAAAIFVDQSPDGTLTVIEKVQAFYHTGDPSAVFDRLVKTPTVMRMHSINGLIPDWVDSLSSPNWAGFVAALKERRQIAGEPLVIAGFSPHFDLRFLERYLDVPSIFSHRVIDIGSIDRLFALGRSSKSRAKRGAHRALADSREGLDAFNEHLRFLRH